MLMMFGSEHDPAKGEQDCEDNEEQEPDRANDNHFFDDRGFPENLYNLLCLEDPYGRQVATF